MPNTFFQFKQFTIHQEHCAMKVTTDACLFGAWAASKIGNSLRGDKILDIGTGTGLLSLMMAQANTHAIIDAVEIDEAAAAQATENFQASAFKERLQLHTTAIQQFRPIHKFDFIVTNPPFFDNELKSLNDKRNLALHSASLSLGELLAAIQTNIAANGRFAILLPYHRTAYFVQLAKDFHLQENVSVKQTEKHQPFRSMLLFSTKPGILRESELIIKQNNQYSTEFVSLLKHYYLHL